MSAWPAVIRTNSETERFKIKTETDMTATEMSEEKPTEIGKGMVVNETGPDPEKGTDLERDTTETGQETNMIEKETNPATDMIAIEIGMNAINMTETMTESIISKLYFICVL